MKLSYRKLGEILVDEGHLTLDQVAKILSLQGQTTARFGEIAASMDWVSEDQVASCLSHQYHYPVVEPDDLEFTQDALSTISSQRALKNLTLPVAFEDDRLVCIIADPINIVSTDELRAAQGRRLKILLSTPTKIKEAILKNYLIEEPVRKRAPLSRRVTIDRQSDRVALLRNLKFETEDPLGYKDAS